MAAAPRGPVRYHAGSAGGHGAATRDRVRGARGSDPAGEGNGDAHT